jgi:RNA polymerase sigma-70 factor (ECF subfamily)
MSDPRPADELDAWIVAATPRALAYARSLVRERADAEDLVHDCFSRLLARADAYDLVRDGTRLLFRSITHAAINWHQRRKPTVGLDGAAGPATDGPEQLAIHNELAGAVREALGELDVTARAIVELRSLGHTLVEVAEMLEMSHANARVQLHRARQKLAVRLKPYLEENVR